MKKFFLPVLAVAACSNPSVSAFAPSPLSRTSTFTSSPTTRTIQTNLHASRSRSRSKPSPSYDEEISSCKQLLNKAVETKAEDPDEVLNALETMEKLYREKRKKEGQSVSQDVLDNLTGSWRLIFTTGTKKTQDRFQTKINYFPLKAVQRFDATTDPMEIENGIYLGNFEAIKFKGDFEFNLKKSKLEFTFDQIALFGFTINLGKGDAEKIGASSGLGSDSNVKNAEKGKKAFFNWISADENIATARGGGGGIALWQKIDE